MISDTIQIKNNSDGIKIGFEVVTALWCYYGNGLYGLKINSKIKHIDDVGCKKLFHAGKEGGLSEVLKDAGGADEVDQETILEGEEDQILGTRQWEKEIRWVVVYNPVFLTFLFSFSYSLNSLFYVAYRYENFAHAKCDFVTLLPVVRF